MKTSYVVPLMLLTAAAGFLANQYWRKDSDLKISFPDMDLGLVNPIQPRQDDCLPAPDAPASVIEYFQRFNKPLPERFCAKEAAPQASHEPPQDSSQTEDVPDKSGGDDGQGDSPLGQYEGDPNGGYESDPGDGYQDDPSGGYQDDQGGGYQDGYQDDRDYNGGDYWKNDDQGHEGGDGKRGKGHGTRKSACKKAHMKWNESTKTCSKRR